MITDFSYFHSEKGIILPIALGASSFFLLNEKEDVLNFYNSPGRHGIKWNFNGKEIVKLDEESSVVGYPSPDLKYVIAIFLGENKNHSAPWNAEIYRADGTPYLKLKPPAFKSEFIINNILKNGDLNPPMDLRYKGALYFDQAFWLLDNGRNEMTIRIVYDKEWYENRLLNTELGEFGKVVNYGRV